MNYEEKLNLAKEALESGSYDKKTIEYIFPELKESDDERIRKEILEYFQQFENEELRGVDISDWIAWLEKQGEQPSAIRWYDVSLIPQEMEELLVEWDSEDATWHEIAFYHADTETFWNGTRQVENVTRWCYIIDLLEKQGQNLVNETDEEIVEAVKDTSVLDIVEPKFKVGDKIENRFSSHRVYDIIGVDLDNQEYHCKHSYCNNEEYLPFEYADKDYELYDDTPTPPDYGDEVKFEPKIYDSVFYYNKGEIKTGKIVDYRADEGIYELDNGVELLPNEIIGIGK